MNVGVDMRVTPKILPDGRIAINITPVVSSLKSSFERIFNIMQLILVKIK
jgi:Flp pilus assembly secretin CpaC